jgi:glycyl-tRNA synthetase
MSFKPAVAAIKCSLLPMNNSEQFTPCLERIMEKLRYYALSCRTEASAASIGRRYARIDELGVPFAITVDFETLNEKSDLFNTVTLRERDSMKQIRIPIDEVASTLNEIVKERMSWEDLLKKYPQVTVKEE